MSKNAVIAIVIIILIILGGWFIFGNGKLSPTAPENTNSQEIVTVPSPATSTSEVPPVTATAKTVTVTYTDSGFSPSTVTINVGDTVAFKNSSSSDFWPATGMHPTHTVYPGSDIKKCGTSVEKSIFDACRNVAPGSSYSFVFTEMGNWSYHNHLNPRQFGKIIVQ